MYMTTLEDKGILNAVVTNQTNSGSLYHVDTYVKADFNPDTGALEGFVSIRQDMTEIIRALNELDKKNTYLEHAAKILRHDMHSGINTYIPRGISSLERRLDPAMIESLKIEAPLKMIKEGLKHTQKVYRGVYEFTNLVKKDAVLTKSACNIKTSIEEYLTSTAYKSQVILNDNLPTLEVNESLFCTAIDNLIRNGLKYNDSDTKIVKVYFEKVRKRFGLAKEYIIVEDNGRGISQADFEHLSKPYTRKKNQKESGTGLGLNICKAILTEHGFEITAEKLKASGTKLKIRIK
jgi:signal transduction histidine kinase